MPTAEATTTVNAEISKVWSFLTDLKKIGECSGIVEEVDMINEQRSRWVLKSQQARTTQTKEVEAQFTTMETNKRIVCTAKGGNLVVIIECDLEAKEKITECKIKLSFDVAGTIGTIFKPMISLTIGSRLEAFIQCLKHNVEK